MEEVSLPLSLRGFASSFASPSLSQMAGVPSSIPSNVIRGLVRDDLESLSFSDGLLDAFDPSLATSLAAALTTVDAPGVSPSKEPPTPIRRIAVLRAPPMFPIAVVQRLLPVRRTIGRSSSFGRSASGFCAA
eukprot:Skav216565  [mRNA]  locus=scaffold1231:41578:44218:+ [translate_table: standard]